MTETRLCVTSGGPMAALQSALGFAVFSYALEYMGMGPGSMDEAAYASVSSPQAITFAKMLAYIS